MLTALLGGEELSEEFRERAKSFSSTISSKIKEIQETWKFNMEKAQWALRRWRFPWQTSWLISRICRWRVDDRERVGHEHGLKTEMTESFLSGMKGLLKNIMYQSLKKNTMYLRMVGKLDEMESKLNKRLRRTSDWTRDSTVCLTVILDQVSEGLAKTQKRSSLTFRKCWVWKWRRISWKTGDT